MTLSNRVALVTGARRIGGVVATEIARRGGDVALVYRSSAVEAERVVGEVRAGGRQAVAIQADLSTTDGCLRAVAGTVERFGRLDVLVNMASLYESRSFDALTVDEWDAQLAVDLRSAFLCAQAAVPHMRRQGGGRIVNFSDWVAASGRPRYPGYLAYYVAKAGVIALSEALALELAADQILVNAVAPGPILAPPDTSDAVYDAVIKATPLGRWGGELEIAKAVLFLIESDFVTGETIRVDGGRHVK
jgi:NAD(P)-dependent dehydrogenase (short-subunit alcohol dehydrogenase family)